MTTTLRIAPTVAALVRELRTALDGGPADVECAAAVLGGLAGGIDDQLARATVNSLSSTILHAEERFSVVTLTVPQGQQTTIHDHLAWGAVAVLRGAEDETVYRDCGDHLAEIGRSTNHAGSITSFTPPGDIHRVGNMGDVSAISLHVYGVDLRRSGSSVRRVYDLPVVGPNQSGRTSPSATR